MNSAELALEANRVSVNFGGVLACDGIDLGVARGEVLGLTGPNGSGKSTLLNAIGGLVSASGSLTVAGETVALGDPREVRRRGIVRTFQTPQNFLALSCLENVLLGHPDRVRTGLRAALLRRRSMTIAERARWADAAEALDRVGLGALAGASASTLTYGQQRLLELARAIVAEPAVLLADEPSAGLNETETRVLAGLLQGVRADGTTVVLIDHKVDFLDSLCDRIVVLQLGRVIAQGTPADIWTDQAVIDAYLGTNGTAEAT